MCTDVERRQGHRRRNAAGLNVDQTRASHRPLLSWRATNSTRALYCGRARHWLKARETLVKDYGRRVHQSEDELREG